MVRVGDELVEVLQIPAELVRRSRDPALERKEKRSSWWASVIEDCLLKVNPGLANGKWKKISLDEDALAFNNHVLMPLLAGHGDRYHGALVMLSTSFDDAGNQVELLKPMEPNTIGNKLRELQFFLQSEFDRSFTFAKHSTFGEGHGAVLKCVQSYVSEWRTSKSTFKFNCTANQIHPHSIILILLRICRQELRPVAESIRSSSTADILEYHRYFGHLQQPTWSPPCCIFCNWSGVLLPRSSRSRALRHKRNPSCRWRSRKPFLWCEPAFL